MIVLNVGNAEETMEWIASSLDIPFDGAVPPFCFPDSLMGPECLFFLRKKWQLERIFADLVQLKA